MRNDEPSTSGRLLSAIIAMGAWSLALLSWQITGNPEYSLIAPVGTAKFYIQSIVLFGIAAPWIALGLSVWFESKDDRGNR